MNSNQNTKVLRHKVLLSILCLCVFVFAASADLQMQIHQQMKQFGAQAVGIYFESPDGKVFTHNADEIFHAASTMKVPVMMQVFRDVESGRLKLDQAVTVKNQFASIIDGSPFSLERADDDDPQFHDNIGKKLPLRTLVEHMINRSSNLATNIVIELVSADRVRELMKEIGAGDMTVLRGVEDTKAYEAGKNNTTSARAFALCLKAILERKRFSDSSRAAMLEILRSQKSTGGIPAGIDAAKRNLRVANKTGEITEISHDGAIIQNDEGQTWILVILTRGVPTAEKGVSLIAALANSIWNQ
jgi:beta-lactamase class A